MARKHSCPYG